MSADRKTWQVEGMHCVHCEAAVVGAVRTLKGLKDVRVSYRKGTMTALWDADILPFERIAARIADAGYALVAERKRRSLWKDAIQLVLLLLALAAIYWIMTRTAVADWMRAFPVARAGMSLGTVPLMLCISLIGGRLNQKFAWPMRIVSAVLVVLMGMSMLVSGLALAGVGVVPYTCWMGMIRSSIYVVDELNDAEPVEEASPAPAYVPACCM